MQMILIRRRVFFEFLPLDGIFEHVGSADPETSGGEAENMWVKCDGPSTG